MSAALYGKFLEKMGHRVVRTESSWWFDVAPAAYLAFPFHALLSPGPEEMKHLLGPRAWLARYACPIAIGRPSYRLACDARDYGLETLSSKARNQTRRGLEACVVRRLDFEELEGLGALGLSRDTLLRQRRAVARHHDEYWRRYYAAAASVEAAETWGAFAGTTLAAYLIAFAIEGSVNILILRSASDELAAYPNNALVYAFTRAALDRPDVNEVSFGLESLQDAVEGVDRFKRGMGFSLRPVGQRIDVWRFLKPCVNRVIGGVIGRSLSHFAGARAGSATLRKMAGALRWYSEQPSPK